MDKIMGNTQGEQKHVVTMTMAEWKKTHRDFKGIYNGQRCVLQMSSRGSCFVPVVIIKEGT